MKKIMGHVTGKLSLSILTMFVLLVGVLAGLDKVTTTKVSSNSTPAANSTLASPVTVAKATKATATSILPADAKVLSSAKELQTAKSVQSRKPLVFEPNRGQSSEGVQYFARSSGYAVFMTSPASAVLEFRQDVKTAERVTMKLNGANEHAVGLPQEPTGMVSNYHIGNDTAKWIDGIPNYAKLRYNNVYPGVDVVYQGDGKNFRYDFVVQPGADPKAIHMAYEGGHGTTIDDKGRLVVALSRSSLTSSKPYVYQEYDGVKHEVSGGYVLTAENDAQFVVGNYDRSKALVIDPSATYAAYAFVAADSFETQITGVALNATSELTCGWTFSPTLDSSITLGQQVALYSLLSSTTLKGSATFVGGTTGNTQANGCALSSTGGIAVVGNTTSGTTFSATANTFVAANITANPGASIFANNINFNKHGFVVETGTTTLSALIAGNGSDVANAVAFDKSGNLHVVGATSSGSQGSAVNNLLTSIVPSCFALTPPVPATCKAAQPEFESVTSTNAYYLYIAAGKITYGTFLGGFSTDEANAVATDASGNAYITGDSTSWGRPFRWENFPIQPPQQCAAGSVSPAPASNTIGCIPTTNPPTSPITPYTFSSGKHAWVASVNPTATNTSVPTGSGGAVSPTLLWSLPIGGDITPNEQDIGTAITVDGNYNVYIGGNTQNPSIASCNSTIDDCITDPVLPGTNNSVFNVVFTAPGVICPSPVLNLTSDQESATNNCSNGGNAAGPGVVAALVNLNGGSGYTGADIGNSVSFSPPDLAPLGGRTAHGSILTVSGGQVTRIALTDQGSGYMTPPTISFPGPNGGGTTATANVVVGAVILGNPTQGFAGVNQDGWVIELNAPGLDPGNQSGTSGTGALINNTTTFNGGFLKPATPVYAPFPAFVFGTLANGDEVNGNGTGAGRGVNPANCFAAPTCPVNGVNQVTGLVTDWGAIPGAVAGSAGPLGNIYVSGSSTAASGLTTQAGVMGSDGGTLVTNAAVVFHRRINASGFDQITGNTSSTTTESPFSPIYTVAEAGLINRLGDLDLGPAVPANAGSAKITTDAITAITFSGTGGATENVTVAAAPNADVVGSKVTITGVVANATLTTITSALTPVFSGTGTIFWVTFTTPSVSPALAPGQVVTIANSNVNYNVAANVLAASAYPGVPAPTQTSFSLAFASNPGAFPDAAANTIAVPNGFNGSFTISGVAGNVVSFAVTSNPGTYASAGNAAFPAVTAAASPVGASTGVAYDPATGRSCIGGWTGLNLPSDQTKGGIFLPPPANVALANTFSGITATVPTGFAAQNAGLFDGFIPTANNAVQPGAQIELNVNGAITPTALIGTDTIGTVTEGLVACTVYNNDVTLTTLNPVISFQMVAGATPTTIPSVQPNGSPLALSTLNPLNQTTISITNPNGIAQPAFADVTWYTPPPFGGSAQGPASATHPANAWLNVDTTPGGTSYTLSLLDPLNPQATTDASRLDPGYYQATFKIVPCSTGLIVNGRTCAGTAGDNAGVPIIVTVNLTVTGTILTNTVFAGGVPTPNAGPAPTGGAPVVLNEGSGWADGSGTIEYINIPIAAQVPTLSPSNSDIVFDVLRDAYGAPLYTNSSTQWPVLGPPSTGGVQSLSMISAGSNYTCANGNSLGTPGSCAIPLLFCVGPVTATTQTCGAPTGGTQAQGTAYVDPTSGMINSYVITNAGSGYSNPPYVVFPIPNAGGTQAQATANITGAPNISQAGGVVDLHPIQFGPFGSLIPNTGGCGETPFALLALPDALTNSNACYIQVRLPNTMLSGAPSGTYSGTFYLYVNSGQLDFPSVADETLPGGSSITFSPVGSSGNLSNCFPLTSPGCNAPPASVTLMAVTVNVLVNPGTLVLQSPWISNVNPGTPAPPFVLTPSILPAVPLAPFTVPNGYTGTITSNNNGLPYIPGITGNTADFHTLRLDSRNLLTGNNNGTFLATVTPGINLAAQVALALSATPPTSPGNGLSSLSLPLFTCTTSSPAIPSSLLGNTGILQYTHDGILQAASASVTTTDITLSIVNPSSLAPGYYASTITYAALNAAGAPITNNNNQPISVPLPVCLKVGNSLSYEYQIVNPGFAAGNVVASGTPTTGMLFLEAGTQQTVELDVFGLGPSQNVNLPANVQGGPQFAPPDSTLELPALFTPLAGTPNWIAPTTVQPKASTPFVGIEGGTDCVNSFGVGTEPVNSCTPAAQQLVIAPQQATLPGTYPNPLNLAQFPAGGVTVTDIALPTQPLLAATNSPMAAVLPVTVSSGPGLMYSTLDPFAVTCNGTTPTAGGCGSLYGVELAPPGFGGTGYPVAPAITFTGGQCASQPAAFATISGGTINAIYITNPGGGCLTTPIISIAPPSTYGGIGNQAEAIALVSNGTVNISFTEVAGSTITVPSSETITILPSRVGTQLAFIFPFPSSYGLPPLTPLQSPTNPTWLAFALGTTNCTPFVQDDPTQSLPGFFNGCTVTVTPNLLAASLPVGTYYAWETIQSAGSPAPQPATMNVLVTLSVIPQGGIPCSITLRDGGNNTSTTLPYTGTAMSTGAANGGFYPSTPLNLTVTPNSATTCGQWTVTTADNAPGPADPSSIAANPSTVLAITSASTGAGVGTVSYDMFGNTHSLGVRTSTITVTAGSAVATYTVNEAASPLSQLQREVEALYQRSLGREPDTGGYNFWTCTTPLVVQPCSNLGIAGLGNMVDQFLASSSALGLNAPLNSPPGQASVGEGESSDFQVIAIYKAMLGTLPTFAQWQAAVAPFRLNETPAGWAAAATSLLNSLLNGQQYATQYGPPVNISNVVTNMYMNLLGRAPSGTELANAITLVTNGGLGGPYNLFYNLAIAPPLSQPAPPNPPYLPSQDTSAEFQNRLTFASAGVVNDHSNSMFVTLLYFAVLGRDPDAGGFTFWSGVANGGGSGIYFQAAAAGVNARGLVEGPGTPGVGLVGSPEFQNLFIN